MADVQPLRALHYDLDVAGPLDDVVAPPYDVIDAEQRAELPRARPTTSSPSTCRAGARGRRPLRSARRELFERWQLQGAVVRDAEPALWAHTQEYRRPDGGSDTRRGFFCRVRIEDYGPGRDAPARAHAPGPKEDRLRLTRATRANISPIFSLYLRPAERGAGARSSRPREDSPWGEVDRRRRHRPPPLARRRPEGDRGRAGGARRRRAADRRRPPPLRDGAGLRRRDRRRGRAPLHADVPGRARGPGPDRVPHPPPRQRARRRAPARRSRDGAARATSRSPRCRLERARRRRPAAGRCSSATSTRTTSAPFRLTLKDQAIADAALERPLRALPPPRHRRARGAAAEGRARPERRGHLPLQRPVLRARHRRGARAGAQRRVRRRVPDAPDARSSRSATSRPSGENMPPKSTYFFPKLLDRAAVQPASESTAVSSYGAGCSGVR